MKPTIVLSSWLTATYPAELTIAHLASNESLSEAVGNNLHLNHEQCKVAFPKLWSQLVLAGAAMRERGGVREEDLARAREEEGTRVAVVGGNVFVSLA